MSIFQVTLQRLNRREYNVEMICIFTDKNSVIAKLDFILMGSRWVEIVGGLKL